MTDKPSELPPTTPHPEYPEGHMWTEWSPKDKRTVWRKCLHPQCKAYQEMEVKG